VERGFAILIVDDDAALASNLQDILEDEGYSVSVANNGAAALALCREQAFNLALIDIKLPDTSGVGLIHQLSELSPKTDYIVITGYASLDSAIEAVKQRRIIAYETKPLDMVRFLAFIKQVSQRRQVEADLVELRKLDQLKDEFISLVSHELRSPLTVIMGAVNTALTEYERLSEQEMRQLLQDAASEADRLSHLLGNLLELSRAQAGQLSLFAEPLDVSKVVRETVSQLQSQHPSSRFVVDLSKKLPRVLADQLRLERILYNLLDNAVKYSPEGSEIRITARFHDQHLIVGVSDHGPGISDEDKAKLFQPFQRLGNPALHTVKGIGLGLVVCRRLVEAHGGRIWVESRDNQGSSFFFTLPPADETGPARTRDKR
jgi:signal transduction histidine kinase